MRDLNGTLLGHVAIARDVTAALSHEEALRDTRDRLQSVLDSAMDVGILAITPAGKISLFNRGAERLFGYAQHEVIGRSTLMFNDVPELQARADQMGLDYGRPVRKAEVFTLPLDAAGGSTLTQWTFIRKNGDRMHCALRFSRIVDRNGQFGGFLAIVMDITAQVLAEQALKTLNAELEQRVHERTEELARAHNDLLRSDKLAALGSMVAGVAHELNTPIGTSLTAASTLADRCTEIQKSLASNAMRRSALDAFLNDTHALGELLMRSLGSAADMVQHFKQLSADQTSEQRRSFELAQVVGDVLSVTRPQLKQTSMKVEVDIEDGLWMDSYPGALGRLLTNLLLNAQLHAFEGQSGGVVRVSAQRGRDGRSVQLTVADNGVGMSAEVERRAFDPFFTTKLGQGGTGLGLNIVHNIATGLLGGSLELQTAPRQGSCFTFELPLHAPAEEPDGPAMTSFAALH
jgi:PAS domain S-box-containing protein